MKGSGKKPWRHLVAALTLPPLVYLLWPRLEPESNNPMGVLRGVFFGCLHAPITHKGYLDWLCETIRDFNPDLLINGGDWFEGLAASRWGKHPNQTWLVDQEFKTVGEQADRFEEAAPNARKYWMLGNHCSNLLHEPFRMTDDLRQCVGNKYAELVQGPLAGWKIGNPYAHSERLRLGPITIQHGCATGKGIPESHLKDQAYAYSQP
jgi:hypothetical protein